jgi:ubiquitin-protein ligase
MHLHTLQPNPADPLNTDAARVLREDPKKFARNVQVSVFFSAVFLFSRFLRVVFLLLA